MSIVVLRPFVQFYQCSSNNGLCLYSLKFDIFAVCAQCGGYLYRSGIPYQCNILNGLVCKKNSYVLRCIYIKYTPVISAQQTKQGVNVATESACLQFGIALKIFYSNLNGHDCLYSKNLCSTLHAYCSMCVCILNLDYFILL